MATLTLANYLGMLQDDPEDETIFQGLRDALGNGDPDVVGQDPIRLLEAARVAHEQRGELRAAAWLIEIEAPLITGDPDLEAALFKELGRLRHEELLDDAGAREGFQRALDLRPGDQEVQDAIEQVDQAAESWKEIAQRFVEEAEEASDAALKTSLMTRAASLIWQYKRRGREKEVDRLFKKALAADPAATRTARLFAETLRVRERWDDLAEVIVSAAEHARNRDDKLNLFVRAGRVFARRLGQAERAAGCYERVLDFSPGHEEALRFLVEYFTEREAWDHLVALYEDALRSRQRIESEQGILLQIGMVHWRIRQKPEEAEPYFGRLRKIDPAHPGMLAFYREHIEGGGDQHRLLTILGDAQRVTKDADQKLALAVELARAAQRSESTLERAIDAWKAVQRLEPTSTEAHSALKDLYARAEKWNALVELLKTEMEALPADDTQRRVALLRDMVPIYRDRLQLDVMVINAYNSILQLAPDDATALEALGVTFEQMERWTDLIQVLTRQADAATDPVRQVAIYTRVARLWIDRFANYNQATKPLEEVIAIDPDNREALAQLKEIYEKKRAWNSLYDVLSKEAELTSDPDVRIANVIELAKLAGDRLHRHGDAIALWRQVVEGAPDMGDALESLERLAEKEKDWATLAWALERRVDSSNDEMARIKVLQKLGTVYGEHLDDPAQAATAWKRVLELDPKNGRALRTLRESFLAAKDWEGLEGLYGEVADWEGLVEVLGAAAERAEDPQLKKDLSFRAAEVYEQRINEPHRAFRNYERVLSVDPDNVRAARALLPIYEKDEKWNRLAALKEVLLRSMGESADVSERLELIGELRTLCLDKLSDEATAFDWSVRAFALAPTDRTIAEDLERSATAAGRYDALVALYLARIEEGSADLEERNRLRRRVAGLAGEKLGRSAEAIAQLEQILADSPQDEEAIELLDRLYRAENRTTELRRLYEHRIENAEDGAPRWAVLRDLARLEEDVLDDPQSAARRYEAMLEIEPDDRDTLAALDGLYAAAGRVEPLAKVLETRRDLTNDPEERVALILRLGQLHAGALAAPQAALEAYAEVLRLSPGNDAAVAGLEGLEQAQPDLGLEVGRLLESAYETKGLYQKLAGVLRRRLEATEDGEEKRALRLRLASLSGSELGDAEGAYRIMESAFLDRPSDVELWDELARVAEKADKHEALATAYATAIESGGLGSGDVAELSTRVARIYDEVLGKPDLAEDYHRKVLHSDPLSERSFDALKELYTTNERWDELQVLYRNRIAETVDGGQKLELLLQVCFLFEELLDDPELAIRAYQDVVDLEPQHVAARRALERLYRRTQRWRDLAALLRQELDGAQGQDAIDLTFELGEIYEIRLSEASAAVDQYESVLSEHPSHLRSQQALERLIDVASQRQRIAAVLEPLYERQGAYVELARVLSVQLEDVSDPASRVGLLLRIAELQEQKLHDLEAAFQALALAVQGDPADARAREELSRIAAVRGTQPTRAAVLEKAIEAAPETYLKGELLMELARLWDESVGDSDAAERAYVRLIEVDGDNPDVVLPASRALERIHLERGDHAQLAVDLRRQVKMEHEQDVRKHLLVRLATVLEETLDDVDGAIAAHRERLDIDPADIDALRSLEKLFERKGEWQRLIGVLQSRESVTLDEAEQRAICHRMGQIYEEKLSDADNAIVAYNEVLSRFGPDRETLAALARLYEATARWEDLLEVTHADYEQVSDPAERSNLRFRAAELMRTRTHELDRSIEAYAEVLAEAPDHEGSISALEEITAGDEREARIPAARVLIPRYEGSANFDKLLKALSVLADADDPTEQLRSLRRAAEVAEVGLEAPSRAFDFMGRAVRAGLNEPDLAFMLSDLERLAEASARWQAYVTLLRDISADVLDGDLHIEVLLKIAQVAAQRLEDVETARTFYAKVLEDSPDHMGALDALEQLHSSVGDHRGLLGVLQRKTELSDTAEARIALLLRQAELSETALEDVAAAIDAYEQVLVEAERPEAFLGLERLYAKAERWPDLASLYQRQLDQGIGSPVEVRYRLGRTYAECLEDPHAALEQFEEAIRTNPNHEPTIESLEGMMDLEEHRATAARILEPVFLQRMDWPKVTAALEARVAAEHDLEERKTLLRRLGQIKEDYLEDLEAAMETYARLFREDPADQDVWDLLARLARNLDRHARLAEIYTTALEEISIDEPATARLAFIAGQLHDDKTGDLGKAARLYRRALTFDPTDTTAFSALESVYRRQNAHQSLLELYREQVDVATSDAARFVLLKNTAVIQEDSLGNPDAAIDVYREILEIDPRERDAVEALDRLLLDRERWDDLADHLRHRIDVAEGPQEQIGLKHRLGEVLADKLDDTIGALDVFEEVAAANPGYEPTVRALEVMVQREDHRLRITQILEPIYRAGDQWKKLIAIFEAQVALTEDPSDAVRLLSEIGELHEHRGRNGALAFQAWARAFAAEPFNNDVREQLDRLAAIMGNWDEHVAAYEQAIAKCDDSSVVSQLMALVAQVHDERRGDPRSAIQTYERLLQHDPDDASPLDSLDALHTMVGDWRGLVDVLTRKVERAYEPAERGELLRRAGSVLEELLGDRDGAIEAYRRATHEDETDVIAFEALDRLYTQAAEPQKLMEVLRSRVALEEDPSLRVEIGLRLGNLCETQLNVPNEAIEAFQHVFDDHPGEPHAVAALARLYERQAMWPDLLENLRLQAGIASDVPTRVALIHRCGEVLERELDDVHEALATYEQALELEGRNEPTIAALMRIADLEDYRTRAAEILEPQLEVQERWDDLATLLDKKAEGATDPLEKRRHLRRLAQVHEQGRRDAEAAFDALSRALAEDPSDQEGAEELERIAAQFGAFDRLADTLAARATSVLDPTAARSLYTRLARVAEERLSDDARAIDAFTRAAEQVGDDDELLASLDRLFAKTQSWNELADVLERRTSLAADMGGRNELLVRLGALRRQQFADLRGAFAAYQEVVERDPTHQVALQALEELASDDELALEVVDTLDNVYRQIGATDRVAALYDVRIRLADTDGERVRLLSDVARIWEMDLGRADMAVECLRRAFELDPRDDALLSDLERLAGATGSWEALRGVVERVAESADVERALLRDLNIRAASWYRDRLGDVSSAETRLRAAISADAEASAAYEQLVVLLRVPGRESELVASLMAWAKVELDELSKKERLREAARLAEGALGDATLAAACHDAILEVDAYDPAALDDLARIRTMEQGWSEVVSLLARRVDVESDPRRRLELRHQIAEVYAGPLASAEQAMEAYQAVLEEDVGDLTAIGALEQLYEQTERWGELQQLIERRLDIATTTQEQIAARVSLARLSETRFGRRAEAIEQLHEILGIDPANAEALDALERLLAADSRWPELIELLGRRCENALASGDSAGEIAVLERLAGVYEEQVADGEQAAAMHERILERRPHQESSLMALVRIQEASGAWERVATALERLVAVRADSPEAIPTAHRLAAVAEEHLGDPVRAEQALRTAFELQPASSATRELLRVHYTTHGQDDRLAELLVFEAQNTPDTAARVVLLKQVAELYDKRLRDPASAAVHLEEASRLVPDDREVLLPLCDLYIAAGRSQDAIPVLQKIIDSYGTRRVKEVAQFHHRLGKALQGMGDQAGAMASFDAAFKIDLTNVHILRDLGMLCHQLGDLDRAQKTFRALLLQKLDANSGITKADVYFFLGDISATQGDKAKAVSMVQRAVAEDANHERAQELLARLKA